MPATLIDAFYVPADKEQGFLANWKKTTEVLSHKKGFIETKLHRNTGVGDQTFLFINIATWESTEAWDRVHGDYHPTEDDPRRQRSSGLLRTSDLRDLSGRELIITPSIRAYRRSARPDGGACNRRRASPMGATRP